MGCPTTTVKISYVVFNVLVAILGIIGIIWIACNPDQLHEDAAISGYIGATLLLIFAALGCYAAIKESVCLTATCAVFWLIFGILEISTTFIDWNDGDSRNGIAVVERAWNNNEMDALQREHKCCGKISPNDYVLLSAPIPQSCYADEDSFHTEKLFIDGCSGKLQDYYDTERVWFLVGTWLLFAIEVIGFLLAVFLVINFRNKQRRLQF